MQNQGNTIKRRPAKKSMDTNVSKLREIMEDREAWHAAVHGVAKAGHNLATEQLHQRSPCVRSRKGERQGGGNGGGKAEQGGRSEPPTRQPPREAGATSALFRQGQRGGGELLGPAQAVRAESARGVRVPCSRRPVLGSGGSDFTLPMACTHPPHTPSPVGVPGRHRSLGVQEAEF